MGLGLRQAARRARARGDARGARPGRAYPYGLQAAPLEQAPFADADLIVLAVTSRSFREVAARLPGSAPFLSLVKGLDPATGERLSTLVRGRPVAVLSGPNMADEVAAGLPGAAVIASDDEELARDLQEAINSGVFRVYVNNDLIGVELCAAAKNVMALAAGAVDGLSLGDNAKAALITRGLVEMARLGEACGASPETFAGLAGMGDLVVSCWHPQGRNRRAGALIAQGATPEEAKTEIGQVVEGLTTAPGAARSRPPSRDRFANHRGRLRGARRDAAARARKLADGQTADRGVELAEECAARSASLRSAGRPRRSRRDRTAAAAPRVAAAAAAAPPGSCPGDAIAFITVVHRHGWNAS